MAKVRFVSLVLALLALLGSVSARDFSGLLMTPDIEAQIRQLEATEATAELEQDFAQLEQLWSLDFTLIGANGAIYVTRGLVFSLFSSVIGEYASVERRVDQIERDGDTVYAQGIESVLPLAHNRAGGPTVRRFNHVWRCFEDGSCRLLVRHARVAT